MISPHSERPVHVSWRMKFRLAMDVLYSAEITWNASMSLLLSAYQMRVTMSLRKHITFRIRRTRYHFKNSFNFSDVSLVERMYARKFLNSYSISSLGSPSRLALRLPGPASCCTWAVLHTRCWNDYKMFSGHDSVASCKGKRLTLVALHL